MSPEENEDWYPLWESAEVRPGREPADFAHEKCNACWDRQTHVVEIPRVRRIGLNDIEMPPARFVLCTFHANKVRTSDSLATIYPLKESRSE